MDKRITRSKGLRGTVTVPGDKSISHRALMLSALADGISEIEGFLDAADPNSTLDCLTRLGITAERSESVVRIHGRGLNGLRRPDRQLDAGNSGTTIRLLSGILAGQPFTSHIAGDDSLNRRPMKRIIVPLSLMGAEIVGTPTGAPPLTISGTSPLRPIEYQMPISSAQVKSAILLAGLFADGTTTVVERTQTRDHTERMLGLSTRHSADGFSVSVTGGQQIQAQHYRIPGDISSAAFLIAAALVVPHSEICITNVGLNPTRCRVLDLFQALGGQITTANETTVAGEPVGDLVIRTSQLVGNLELNGKAVAELIDEIPIIAVTLALSGSGMTVHEAADLRTKESDRIHAVTVNLRRLGFDVDEYDDGFAFQGKNTLLPAQIDSFGDHRIAMAFAVAGLVQDEGTVIANAECVDISFPSFWSVLNSLEMR